MLKIAQVFSTDKVSQLETKRESLADELRRLESDDSYQVLARARKVEKDIGTLRARLADIADDIKRANARPAMDSRIVAALRWADGEKLRTSRELRTSASIKRNIFGGSKGILETNSRKINARVEALDVAILALQKLADSPPETLDMEIAKIQAGIPILDVGTESIPCSAGMAGTLQP